MVDEPTSAGEGATATEEAAEGGAEATPVAIEAPKEPGQKPIPIPKDELTEESKKKVEEDTGKPVEYVPYTLAGEDKQPHSILRLKFEVAPADFQKEIDKFYENLRKDVVLPGYRKGKAPVRLIRIRMGEEADRDAMASTAMNALLQEAIKRPLKLVSDPQIVSWKIEEGKPLQFEIETELEPTVELKEYKGLTVTVETREITDADVEHEIEHMRQDHAKQVSAPEGTKLAEEHSVAVDLKVEGEGGRELPHLARENWLIADINRNLPGDVASALLGHTAGETVRVPLKGTRKNRRGDEIEFTDTYVVTIREIKATELPALDDEFAKDLGEHDTIQALRDAIKKDLQEAEENRRRNASIGKIIAAIIEKNPVEAPRTRISDLEVESVMRDSYQLSRMGLRLQDVVTDAPTYFATQHSSAEFRVKQALLLPELAKLENLEVSDEDVEKEINEMAEKSGRKPLAVRARLEAEKKLDALRDELRGRKVQDFLLANNTVEKVAAPAKSEHEGHDHEHGHEHSHEPAAAPAEGGEKKA